MKKRVDSPAPPRQFYTQRPDGSYTTQEVWCCGECNLLSPGHHTKEDAENCCKIRRCGCGNELPEYWLKCGTCQNAARVLGESERFAKMPVVAYADQPCYRNENFYTDMDELLDNFHCQDEDFEWPEFVEVCDSTLIGARLSSDDVMSYISEQLTEHHEEPDSVTIIGGEELEAAVKAFLDKQTYKEWEPNGTKVKVPTKEESEI